jgi:hypothetical protein
MSLVTEIKRNERIHHITVTLQRPVTDIETAHTVTTGSCKTTKHILGNLLQNISHVNTLFWSDLLHKLQNHRVNDVRVQKTLPLK